MLKEVIIKKSNSRGVKCKEYDLCFNCNNKADQMHHIIPYSLGGRWVIPMCEVCHKKCHNKKHTNITSHSELVKMGIKRAKKEGKKWGKKAIFNKEEQRKLVKLFESGFSYREIGKKMGCSISTISRYIKTFEKEGLLKNNRKPGGKKEFILKKGYQIDLFEKIEFGDKDR